MTANEVPHTYIAIAKGHERIIGVQGNGRRVGYYK